MTALVGRLITRLTRTLDTLPPRTLTPAAHACLKVCGAVVQPVDVDLVRARREAREQPRLVGAVLGGDQVRARGTHVVWTSRGGRGREEDEGMRRSRKAKISEQENHLDS